VPDTAGSNIEYNNKFANLKIDASDVNEDLGDDDM
jgi:hypothetical protein